MSLSGEPRHSSAVDDEIWRVADAIETARVAEEVSDGDGSFVKRGAWARNRAKRITPSSVASRIVCLATSPPAS